MVVIKEDGNFQDQFLMQNKAVWCNRLQFLFILQKFFTFYKHGANFTVPSFAPSKKCVVVGFGSLKAVVRISFAWHRWFMNMQRYLSARNCKPLNFRPLLNLAIIFHRCNLMQGKEERK